MDWKLEVGFWKTGEAWEEDLWEEEQVRRKAQKAMEVARRAERLAKRFLEDQANHARLLAIAEPRTHEKKLQERGRKVRESATCPSARVGKRAIHAGKRAKSAACASAQSILRACSQNFKAFDACGHEAKTARM